MESRKMNMKKLMASVAAAGFAALALADFDITIDANAKPIKDMGKSGCNQGIGFNAALESVWGAADDNWWFVSNKVETARVLKEAGVNLMRLQCMNAWFNNRRPNPYDADSKDPKERSRAKNYRQSNPEAAFDFYKANGFKVFVCLECWNEKAIDENVEIVKWIVENGYKECVAGFEMGNETYGSPKYPTLAPFWKKFIDRAEKIWPGIPLGMNIGELYELNPDITHMRNRLMSDENIKRDWTHAGAYFSADNFNRYSMQFVYAMSNYLHKIDHIIYHAYGAETPYSCSYHGFKRFRNFTEIVPELKGKRYWLTEIRPRSDEDNHCQRQFREALIMGHYTLMALCQPETDAFCHHQLTALSGAIYQSGGREWYIQWYDGSQESLPDFRAPYNLPRLEVGALGVVYRILGEGIRECPVFLAHGLDKMTGTEEDWCASSRLTDDVYTRRRAIQEGGKSGGFLGIGSDYPKVRGNVEWVAAVNNPRNKLCLLMVNSKSTPETIRVSMPGKVFAAPTYRTVTCPEEFLDCCEIPGDGRPWRQLSWEDTNTGYWFPDMAMNKGMKPQCDIMTVTIRPHTVQTVTVRIRNAPKK